MTIEEAIEKAEEHGYKGLAYYNCEVAVHEHVLLDLQFWQALHKAQGGYDAPEKYTETTPEGKTVNVTNNIQQWKLLWFDFLECLAAGGTPAEYFRNLN